MTMRFLRLGDSFMNLDQVVSLGRGAQSEGLWSMRAYLADGTERNGPNQFATEAAVYEAIEDLLASLAVPVLVTVEV